MIELGIIATREYSLGDMQIYPPAMSGWVIDLCLQELAIINRTTRQSTVIAKETLELLAIDVEVWCT